jgi:penicillin-binding protein 2
VAAIIANRGYYYTPHIVSGIGKKDNPLPEYKVRHESGIEPRHFETIIPGMVGAVEAGTVMRLARIADVQIAGKTGTSQNKKGKAHAIFIGFAPADNPKIAIAAFVENGEWGGISAAPVANLVIERYLKGKTENKALENYIITTRRFTPFLPAQKPKPIEKDTVKKKQLETPLAEKKTKPSSAVKVATSAGE